jgi:hypothetical protein
MKSLRRLSCAPLSLLAAFACSTALAFPPGHDLYIQPAGTGFIEKTSGETIVPVNVSSGVISDAQTQLDNARAANPSAVIVLTLSGTYSVSSAPLRLPSHTCLVLSTGCVIQAASSSVAATALIEISSQTNVSIAGGTLDGSGAPLNAIHVITSDRVHIDKVVARNCAADGIAMTGHGNTTFDNELIVTRSEVSGCTGNGISATSGTQTVCSDNYCHNNGAAGIYLGTAHSTAVNNRCVANATGIVGHGASSAITDNTIDANGVGVTLDTSSNANLCTSNVISNSTTAAINDAGTNDVLFQNALSGNATNLNATGTGAVVVAWRGSLSASGQNYFYPPLIDDQHTAAIENGKARTDVTIGATSLATVQSQYNSARSAHPNDVIVLHLTGATYTGSSSLTLTSDTCILLSGTINLSSGVTGIVASGKSHISISGGTIDGGGSTSAMAIDLSSGCGSVQIDSMTIRNFGPVTPRSSGGVVRNASGVTPFIVSRCTFNGGSARGLWTETTGFTTICTDSTFSNFNMDGIDLDAHTSGSLVKFNTCNGNLRCGIFVEQSDTYNQLIGNVLTGNYRCAVSVWNNGVNANESPGTNWNSLICNSASSSIVSQTLVSSGSPPSTGYGIETGSQAGSGFQEYTSHNLYFNNDVMDNQGAGIRNSDLGQGVNGTTQSVQNFFAQNIVANNATDYALSPNGGEKFFNPRVPDLGVAAPVFSPGGGNYGSVQSVTITTGTSGASIRYTTDGSVPTSTTGTPYTTPVSIAATTTLQAIAYKSGMPDSSVTSATYTISSGSVTLTSADGFFNAPLSASQNGVFTVQFDASASLSPSNVTIGLSQGSQTAYTGMAVAVRFNPTGFIDARNGGAYGASSIAFTANTTYHFRLVVDVPNHLYSAFVTAPGGSEQTVGSNFAFRTEQAGVTALDTTTIAVNATPGGSTTVGPRTIGTTVATPSFSPGGGTYNNDQSVLITTSTSGASIRYTLDGSTPTSTTGTLYSGAVPITASATLKAIAYKAGLTDSAVASSTYTLQVAPPAFSPAAGTYSTAQSITLTTATTGATIRYTTDGSTPTATTGTVYTGAIAVNSTTTIKAIGVKTGYSDSSVATAVYTITLPQVAAPVFSPAGGTFSTTQNVTITTTTNGATIRYTIDGSAPSETNGTIYSGAVAIATTTTLKAIAYASGMSDSTITSATYTISAGGTTYTVANGFVNIPLSSSQSGSFTAQFDASVSISPSNTTLSLCQGAQTAYTGLACMARFNNTGTIDARNGGAFAAASSIPFSAGVSYHFRFVVNVASHTYSVFVTPAGGSELTVGSNYAFRTEQAGVTALDNFNVDVNATPGGSVTVSAVTISGPPPTVAFEAESLTRTSSGATTTLQTDSLASGGQWVSLDSTAAGQYVEYTTPSIAAGTYSVQIAYKAYTTRGILNLKVDGTQIGGTVDQYASPSTYTSSTFGNVTFATAGTHVIRLTVTGKNASSTSYILSADKFTFVGQ